MLCAPKAVLSNWANEFDRWLGNRYKVVLYDPGPPRQAQSLQQEV
jgi:hypothetical protein